MGFDDCAQRRLCQRLPLFYAFPVPKLSNMPAIYQWLKNIPTAKLAWILTTILISNCLLIDPSLGATEQKILNTTSTRHPKLQILLPLYIYPNWYDKNKYVWKQVIAAAKKVSIVVIIIGINNCDDRYFFGSSYYLFPYILIFIVPIGIDV